MRRMSQAVPPARNVTVDGVVTAAGGCLIKDRKGCISAGARYGLRSAAGWTRELSATGVGLSVGSEWCVLVWLTCGAWSWDPLGKACGRDSLGYAYLYIHASTGAARAHSRPCTRRFPTATRTHLRMEK